MKIQIWFEQFRLFALTLPKTCGAYEIFSIRRVLEPGLVWNAIILWILTFGIEKQTPLDD